MDRWNETYKYLGILEVDTMKQVKKKEKIKVEKYSKLNSIAGISTKE